MMIEIKTVKTVLIRFQIRMSISVIGSQDINITFGKEDVYILSVS
jgi:hypothetical protein